MTRFDSTFDALAAPSRRGFLKGSAIATTGATFGATGATAEDDEGEAGDAVGGALFRHDLVPGARFEIAETDLSWTPPGIERAAEEYRAYEIRYAAAPSKRALLAAPADAGVDADRSYEFRTDAPVPIGETNRNLVEAAFDPVDA